MWITNAVSFVSGSSGEPEEYSEARTEAECGSQTRFRLSQVRLENQKNILKPGLKQNVDHKRGFVVSQVHLENHKNIPKPGLKQNVDHSRGFVVSQVHLENQKNVLMNA